LPAVLVILLLIIYSQLKLIFSIVSLINSIIFLVIFPVKNIYLIYYLIIHNFIITNETYCFIDSQSTALLFFIFNLSNQLNSIVT